MRTPSQTRLGRHPIEVPLLGAAAALNGAVSSAEQVVANSCASSPASCYRVHEMGPLVVETRTPPLSSGRALDVAIGHRARASGGQVTRSGRAKNALNGSGPPLPWRLRDHPIASTCAFVRSRRPDHSEPGL